MQNITAQKYIVYEAIDEVDMRELEKMYHISPKQLSGMNNSFGNYIIKPKYKLDKRTSYIYQLYDKDTNELIDEGLRCYLELKYNLNYGTLCTSARTGYVLLKKYIVKRRKITDEDFNNGNYCKWLDYEGEDDEN